MGRHRQYRPFGPTPEEERKGELQFVVVLAVFFADWKWGTTYLDSEWLMLVRLPLGVYVFTAVLMGFMALCKERRWPAAIALVLGTVGGCGSARNGREFPEGWMPLLDLVLFIVVLSGVLAGGALVSERLGERSRK